MPTKRDRAITHLDQISIISLVDASGDPAFALYCDTCKRSLRLWNEVPFNDLSADAISHVMTYHR